MEQIRATAGNDQVLALDSGDLFPIDPSPGRPALLLKLMASMDYQAVGIGDQDLSEGVDVWRDVHREAGLWNETSGQPAFPWLSGGYRWTSGARKQQMLVPPWTVLDRGGRRIGIVSVVGPEAWRFASTKPEGLEMADPTLIVQRFLHAAAPLDLAIVLSHQGQDEDRAMAQTLEGIDLIVGGHSQSLISPPEVVNGIAICQAGKNGENLGVLVLSPNSVPQPARTSSSGPEIAMPRGENAGNDPFLPTLVATPRWRIAQRIVPLTTAIEDLEPAARLIDAYYAEWDRRNAERLVAPDPRAKPQDPQIAIGIPLEPLVLAAGERRTVDIRIANRGRAPLLVERVRSKSPWMSVLEVPSRVEPGTESIAKLEVAADRIDRFFRCEFTVLANDPLRRVIQGAFSGHVEGSIPGILDVKALWTDLVEMAGVDAPCLQDEPTAFLSEIPPLEDAVPPLVSPVAEIGSFAPLDDNPNGAERSMAPDLASGLSTAPSPRRVVVEYFFALGCPECKEVERLVLPSFTNRFGASIDFRKLDVTAPSNYLRLATLQERLRIRSNEPVTMIVDESIPLLGLDAIRTNLERIVAERLDLAIPMLPAETPGPSVAPIAPSATVPPLLADRLRSFTPPAVLIAGLVDGINPCAFATIVFFITLLGVSGVKGTRLLPVGAGYSLAVFGTYLLMGFGAFRLLQTLQGWAVFGTVLRWTMLGALVLLALFSFRDAWAFRRTGRVSDVALQLPDGLKRRMHETMRRRLSPGSLFVSALSIGVIVTLIEAVCTGQVYLPTLVLLSRYAETRLHAFSLLMLYNLMFILPLLAVIAAAYFGTRNPRLLDWSKRNVVWGKVAMGLLFIALAAVLALT